MRAGTNPSSRHTRSTQAANPTVTGMLNSPTGKRGNPSSTSHVTVTQTTLRRPAPSPTRRTERVYASHPNGGNSAPGRHGPANGATVTTVRGGYRHAAHGTHL